MDTAQVRLITPAVTVTTAETTLTWSTGTDTPLDYIKAEIKRLQTVVIRVANVGAALTSLKVYGKVHANDTKWVPLVASAADYTDGGNVFLGRSAVHVTSGDAYVSTNAYTLPASNYTLLVLHNPCFAQIKLTATCATSTVLNGWASGYDAAVPLASGLGGGLNPATANLQKLILAAQGIMPVLVGHGTTAVGAGAAMAITLHATIACKYFWMYSSDGAATVYYRENGAAATGITGAGAEPTLNKPFSPTMSGKLIVLATPATSITLWGASASGYICWSAGNDA